MYARLDLELRRSEGSAVLRLHGDDTLLPALVRDVHLDVELAADEHDSVFVRVTVPDRQVVLGETLPIAGELLFEWAAASTAAEPWTVALETVTPSGILDLTSAVHWRLIDFSGALTLSRSLAAAERFAEAAEAAEAAVTANAECPGFRVVLGRHLVRAGNPRKGRQAFDDELARFPGAYRAMGELAALEVRANGAPKAIKLCERALALYPNHTDTLLTFGEALLMENSLAAVDPLARAWRLSGALAAENVTQLLDRRRRHDLWDVVQERARGAAPAEAPPSAPPPKLTRAECTVEDVIRLVANDVFRDGRISPAEQQLFLKIRSRFPLPADRLAAIVTEAKRLGREASDGAELEPKRLFRTVLEKVYEDGALSRDEATILLEVAKILGLSRGDFTAIDAEVKAAMAGR